MPYPDDFTPSLRALEKSRASRKKQEMPHLTAEERSRLLVDFHPDHRKEGLSELRLGPNKGSLVPKELARTLEAYSFLPQDFSISAPDKEVDVLVIGGGGAGTAAALTAAEEEGISVLLATKLRLGDANTVMAEGGMSGALRKEDDPVLHFLDTMGGGHYFNDPEIVEALVLDAPQVFDWLIAMGVMFDRETDGSLKVNYAGGHTRKRLHSCKDMTGLELMRVLRDQVRSQNNIEVIEFSPATELLIDEDGRCAGAVLFNLETQEYLTVRANSVVLATGGIGRLHIQNFPTTNHYGATADGLVLGYRAGAELLHMDSIQYHPTGVVWPEQLLGQLITEVMRGHGAHLVNVKGERFINELECRDSCSAGIIRECYDRKKGVVTPTKQEGVWLDTPLISGADKHFAGIYLRFIKYGIDITKEPILIFPTQHYQNGGLKINIKAETTISGLYAAGEVAGGVQGKNRLGGNSLLDLFVFGRRAGREAVANKSSHKKDIRFEHLSKYEKELQALGIPKTQKSPLYLPKY